MEAESPSQKPTTLVIDGTSLLNRTAFAIKEKLTGGHPRRPVWMVLAMLRSIHSLCATHRPQRIFLTWETGPASWRRRLAPHYKATFQTPPDPLPEARSQIPEIRSLTEWLGITNVDHRDFESADIVSWVVQTAPRDQHLVIISADPDVVQLAARPNVEIVNRDKHISLATFADHFPISPLRYEEWRALQGDHDIRGIARIGSATATKLINSTTNQQELEAQLTLRQAQEEAKLARATEDYVATLRTNLEVFSLNPWATPNRIPSASIIELTTKLHTPPQEDSDSFTDHAVYNGLPSIGQQCPEWLEVFPLKNIFTLPA